MYRKESEKKQDPEFFIEIFVQPGDFYWGDSDTRIRTLLGSCVSICLWHPMKKVGGMCHYLLPDHSINGGDGGMDARYADQAMQLFLDNMQKTGLKPREFMAKLFGGGNMFSHVKHSTGSRINIGERNIQAARDLLALHKIRIVAEDTGGNLYRKLVFDLWSGNVWLKKQSSAPGWVDPIPAEE